MECQRRKGTDDDTARPAVCRCVSRWERAASERIALKRFALGPASGDLTIKSKLCTKSLEPTKRNTARSAPSNFGSGSLKGGQTRTRKRAAKEKRQGNPCQPSRNSRRRLVCPAL